MAFRSLSFACVTSVLHRRLADERGFTIIEVLMSAVIVAMAAVGTFSALDSATATSGRNKARTTASQLAQTDQERLRSLTPLQLAALADSPTSTTKAPNGRTFTIASSATWVTDPSGTSSCAGMGKEAGYQRITSTVTWNGQASFSPVTVDSIKAVKNGGYGTSHGSLAVKVYNRAGGGQANIPVSITGPKNYSVTTDSNGCVLLGLVPVGSYNVAVSKPGYVRDILPNDQAVTEPASVAGEQTSSVSLNYDQAGSLGVAFKTRVPPSTSDVNPSVGSDGFTVGSTGLGFPNRRSFGGPATASALTRFTGANNAAVGSGAAQKVLYPFTSAYSVWAGVCSQNEPTQYGAGAIANGTATITAGGALSGVVARLPTMGLKVTNSTNGNFANGTLKITSIPTGCTKTVSKAASSTATINTPLPYGAYTVCVQDATTASARRYTATVQNRTTNGTTPTAPASNTITMPASPSSAIPPC